MTESVFAPGLRFSMFDAIILLLGVIASIAFGLFVWWMGAICAFTVIHFFLFCNVFRISRTLELVWAGVFIALCGATILFQTPDWLWVGIISLGVTVVVVLIEMRKPSYHGIGWQRINPNLQAWWEQRFMGKETK